MKKILIGVVITLFVLVGGCTALMGGMAKSASDTINQMEDDKKSKDELYNEMAKKVNWEVKKGEYSSEIVGVFENTSGETIDYIQFNYKLYDGSGVTIESSFINETDIKPGEKREVKIMLIKKDFSKYEIDVVSSAI